ncbi:hypothetical protein [Absicoccus porci]|uniref:hypothetical protein n=1 Tax=Absicoccus porci TaxID=2486576 RepID=UPI002943E497|nr:hypothetical protein [Absicoccus porci]
MAMKKGTVIVADSSEAADMLYKFTEKYPGLRSSQIANYAGISEATLSKIKARKPVSQSIQDKVIKAVKDLDTIGSFEEIYKELRLKGCLGSVGSSSLAAFKAQEDNRKLQMELGGICIQYGLSKRDLMKFDQIKKYGKESVLDYLMDHHMTIKACEKVYNASTAFDAVSAIKSMKGNHRDKSVTAVK